MLIEVSENENRLGQAGHIGQSSDVIEPDPISLEVSPPPKSQRPKWMDSKVQVVKDGKTSEIPIGLWLKDNVSQHIRGT